MEYYLSKRRKELGKTQKEVADYIGVTEATVSRWESGNIANMRRDRIKKYAEVLQTTPAAIMGIEADSEYDVALLKAARDRAQQGCFDAEDKMFSVFGDELDSLSLRIAGNKFAVLFYYPFSSRDSAGMAMEILGMLRELSPEELLAVAGMLRGFVNRKDILEV